jgi:hypothetical protein
MVTRWIATAALIWVALAASAPPALAAADKPPPSAKVEAQRHYRTGLERVQAGAYGEALVEFRRAYELRPNFAVLYNIAAAQVALGDAVAAIEAFERYLADGGAAVPPERRAKVEAELRHQQARIGRLRVVVSPATGEVADVSVDGTPMPAGARARVDAGEGMRVNPGTHTVTATLPGYAPASATVDVKPGEQAEARLALMRPAPPIEPAMAESAPPVVAVPSASLPAVPAPPAAANPSAPPVAGAAMADRRPSSSAAHTAGYVVGAAGLAALAAGGLIYLKARSDWRSAIDRGCTTSGCPPAGAPYWDDARAGVTTSRIVGAGGGLLLAGGIVLLLSGRW